MKYKQNEKPTNEGEKKEKLQQKWMKPNNWNGSEQERDKKSIWNHDCAILLAKKSTPRLRLKSSNNDGFVLHYYLLWQRLELTDRILISFLICHFYFLLTSFLALVLALHSNWMKQRKIKCPIYFPYLHRLISFAYSKPIFFFKMSIRDANEMSYMSNFL